MGRNETFPPSTSLSVMGEIAGVNAAPLGRGVNSSKTSTRLSTGFGMQLCG